MRVAAVVLAAGSSRRLGELKQLVRLGKESLLERAIWVCREAGCDPVVVVLGASANLILGRCSLEGTWVVVNEDWAEGMGSSVRSGVTALGADVDGCVVTTCDMPAISAAHLLELMRTEQVTASAYAGRRGVPAFFPRGMFESLMELSGDTGARELLQEARVVNLPGGELDVDTVEDLARVRKFFE